MKLSKKLVASLVLSASLISVVGVGSASAAPIEATDSVNPSNAEPGAGGSSWYYKKTYYTDDGRYVKVYFHYDSNGNRNGVKSMFFYMNGVFEHEDISWS